MEWISVKDRLPPNTYKCSNRYFITYFIGTSRRHRVGYITTIATWTLWGKRWWWYGYPKGKMTVTHWMLLPEPPKE